MSGKLQQEILKERPFDALEQEAYLNVIRTADVLLRDTAEVLKPAGLSTVQYNVLRILRGMKCTGGPSTGLACREVAERMITRDPDMTRLLDRLEKRGLISRSREEKDRRVVRTCITEAGLELLASLDDAVLASHRKQLRHLGDDRLRQLIELLEDARLLPEKTE
jgi:DNA-binding MarR family transcriptional regulator